VHVSAPDANPPVSIQALIAELTELPANPSVAVRVLQLLDSPDADVGMLGRLVEADPSLAAHTMRLANAPVHGLTRRVTSARQAVMVLGFALVRSLAALTAGGVLVSDRRAAPPRFWQHSLAVAAGSTVVARHTGRSVGEACSAGLLHDLGSALQYRVAPRRYLDMLEATPDDPAARYAAEVREFDLDHAEAGAAVLAAWGFPADVVEVLRAHHRLPRPGTGDLVLVVRAAEALADLVQPVDPGEALADPADALRDAGVEHPDVETLTREVARETRDLRTFLA
jgi:putative nucleotidyltransferase with HDIG domain